MPLCQKATKQLLSKVLFSKISNNSYYQDFNTSLDNTLFDETLKNGSLTNSTASEEKDSWFVNDIKMIKVIVLVVVVGLLLLSTCKVVFNTSSKYQKRTAAMD